MRSRWFHRPLLHSPALGLEKRATWLELFYDLVFVAAFIQLGNGLSERTSGAGILAFGAVFMALWVAWTGLVFFINRYTVDDFVHRLTVFVQMFAVGGMAISVAGVLEGQRLQFSLACGVALLTISALYLRARLQVPESRDYALFWGAVFGVSGLLWVASGWTPAPFDWLLWVAATTIILGSPLSRPSVALSARYPLDFEHLGERYSLLTLIVLGESFVKVLSTLASSPEGLRTYAEAGVVLLITCGVWWIYFDDIAGAPIKRGKVRWVLWLYGHAILQMSITALGVALKKVVHSTWDEVAPDKYRWLLSGSVALTFAAVALIDSASDRKQAELTDRARINARWMSACVVLVLAPAGHAMSGGLYVTLVMLLVVSQVVFDMMVSPQQENAHVEHNKRSLAEVSRSGRTDIPIPPPRDASTAVRKGTPSELRKDLFFYFMSGGWLRVFVAFIFLFLTTNLFFASLYVLDPSAINNARPASFSDAFFFSVQTMSTVGYGAMSPGSTYGNAVVTLETALSMLAVAIVTGFVFQKASKPKASILFSDVLVVGRLNGKATLLLRVGNARGNDIVDASMDVVVLRDETSAEGIHLRRLHALKLERSRSPMFVLTWTGMHVIDETSPLHGVDWSNPRAAINGIVVTVMGHDGTYAQTVYARKVYTPDQLRVGHRFVDVMEQLEDGRMLIDFQRFHDTTEDTVAKAALCGEA